MWNIKGWFTSKLFLVIGPLVVILGICVTGVILFGGKTGGSTGNQSGLIDRDEIDNVKIMMRSLNQSVDPCTDFYRYTCGNMTSKFRSMSHSARASSWSSTSQVRQAFAQKVLKILTDADSKTDNEGIRKVRKFYRACINDGKIQRDGVDPLKSFINDNGGWPLMMEPGVWNSKNITWQQLHLKLTSAFAKNGLWSVFVNAHFEDSWTSRIFVSAPRSVVDNEKILAPNNTDSTAAYSSLKVKVLNLLRGSSNSSAELDEVALEKLNNFEYQLAQIKIDTKQNDSEIDEAYKLMSIREFQDFYDNANMSSPTAKIDWLEMISKPFATLTPKITIDESEQIVVPANPYFLKFAALLNNTSSETIVDYMMWRIIMQSAFSASDDLADLIREFRGQLNEFRYSRVAECAMVLQSERAVFHAYVKEYSSVETKQAVKAMVDNIQRAMEKDIQHSAWLDEDTKKVATEKMEALTKWISYPDNFSDAHINNYYSEFKPTEDYFHNIIEQRTWITRNDLRKLRAPMDEEKHTWFLEDLLEVMYLPVSNTIMIPAGYLQLPFFNGNRSSVLNYGTIGMAIGHEIAHALGSNGRKYDSNGQPETRWSQSAIDKYEEKAQCFVEQYNNYTHYKNASQAVHVNGSFTLSENIADTVGLQGAWNGYKSLREKRSISDLKLEDLKGFTDDQMFFLAFGKLWCTYESYAFTRTYGVQDVHSPANARVNGAVSNSESFAQAFNCSENSAMNPPKKCTIWG